jgi:predicted transposase/invertase (TIGR01784 family)
MRLGIDPKVDYVFKKLFGSEANKSLLIDLLNAVLVVSIPEPLDDIQILNPFNDKDTLDDKLSILDIKARDRTGRLYNIEMQMVDYAEYPNRVLYYWARLYQEQLHQGEDYSQLRPTFAISIVNGVLTEGSDYHQEFILASRKNPLIVFCRDLSIHLIELPKFTLSLPGHDALNRWCWLLQEGEEMETANIPKELQGTPVEKAIGVLQIMAQSDVERERYESRLKALRDQRSILSSAKRHAQAEGEALGEARGEARGELRGRINELLHSLQLMLEMKFADAGKAFFTRIENVADVARLRAIQARLTSAESIGELEELVASS